MSLAQEPLEVSSQPRPAQRYRENRNRMDRFVKITAFVLLLIFSIVMSLPVYFMLSTALKDQQTVFLFPPKWIPWPMHWENFWQAMLSGPFGAYFKNTFYYSIVGTALELVSSAVVAFGFARYKGRGNSTLFYILLMTMMIPFPTVMIPQFIMFKTVHWINTYLPLIVPSIFATPYIVFLLRQFFNSLPAELFDAARIDGCSEFRTFGQIALPLCKPALTAAAIFGFTGRWNDYLGPLIFLNDESKYTLSIGLSSFSSKFSIIPWHLMMAATIVAVLPLVILFFFAQRFFVEGIVITGIK